MNLFRLADRGGSMKQKKAGKLAAVIAVGIAIVFLFFYIMCRPSLTQVAGYPTTLPSGSLQNKYYWLPIKVGVKVETSKDTILTYVPKSNYNIALYDIDRTKKVWHVTNESAN